MPMKLPKAAAQRLGVTSPGRSKYGAKRTTVDGITFASKREATAYVKLKALEKAGAISELTLQPKYTLEANGRQVCTYVGDFQWFDKDGWHVGDAKGYRTPVYRLKKKLMLACYGIAIEEL